MSDHSPPYLLVLHSSKKYLYPYFAPLPVISFIFTTSLVSWLAVSLCPPAFNMPSECQIHQASFFIMCSRNINFLFLIAIRSVIFVFVLLKTYLYLTIYNCGIPSVELHFGIFKSLLYVWADCTTSSSFVDKEIILLLMTFFSFRKTSFHIPIHLRISRSCFSISATH